MPYKINRHFGNFLKLYPAERKKSNYCVSRTTLGTQKLNFRKNLFCLSTHNVLRSKIYIFCRHQKNASHTIRKLKIRIFANFFRRLPFMQKQEKSSLQIQ